jgi:hypothetical protein
MRGPNRNRIPHALAILAALSALASASCIRYGGPSSLKRDLSREAGVELDAGFAMTVTRSGIALARLFTDEDEVPLRGVRRVEVGVYEVKGLRPGVTAQSALTLPELPGLVPIVSVRDEDEQTFVLVQEDETHEIRQLVIIAAEDDEWVLVRIRGKLRKTIERSLQLALDKADHPEQYDDVLRAYHEREAEAGG